MTDNIYSEAYGDDENNTLVYHFEYIIPGPGQTPYYRVFNTIYGGGGNDEINVPGGYTYFRESVTFFGEDGNDHLSGSTHADILSGGLGDDFIETMGGDDIVDGGEGTDTLYAGTGQNRKTALSELTITGIETLILSTEVFVGDFDFRMFDAVMAPDYLDPLRDIIFRFSVAAHFSTDNFIGNFNCYFDGSRLDDVINASALGGSSHLVGEIGNDILISADYASTLEGGSGNDTLHGGAQSDTLIGGNGNDRISGGGGNDKISTGNGNDTVHAGEGDDWVTLPNLDSHDRKTIYGDGGNDSFFNFRASIGNRITLLGGDGDDLVELSGRISAIDISGVERLRIIKNITAGADFLNAFEAIEARYEDKTLGKGSLVINFSSGGEFTWKSQSTDLRGKILGSSDKEVIDMSNARRNWSIYSEAGNDVLIGNDGSNILSGSFGNDVLKGGKGNDNLVDGYGNNKFVFEDDCGIDSIPWFDQNNARNRIDLSSVSSIRNYDDLVSNHITMYYSRFDIQIDNNNIIHVSCHDHLELRENMFLF